MPQPDPAQYDAFAGEYESHAEVAPYNALYDRPATLRLIGDVAGRRVLDAACGPGIYLEELLDRGADVVGCDGSAAMVELARARVGGRAERPGAVPRRAPRLGARRLGRPRPLRPRLPLPERPAHVPRRGAPGAAARRVRS